MRSFSWREMWEPQWPPAEVVLRAAIIYFVIEVLFRLVGRRQLASYSIFDIVVLFLVTVAARTSIVGQDSSLTTAILALATIVGLNRVVSFATRKSALISRIMQGSILELVRDGRVMEGALQRARMSQDQLMAEVRLHGHQSLDAVAHAYLEHNGRVSFIWRQRT